MSYPNLPPTQPQVPPLSYLPPGLTWSPSAPRPQVSWWQNGRRFWGGSSREIRIALAAALVVGVCIGAVVAVQALRGKPDGYLYTDKTGVVFVQLTEEQSGHLTGTWHTVYETTDQAIKSEDLAFTGVEDGSRVSLTFSALGFSKTITGTLSGDTLTLQMPDQNGYIATNVFHAASVGDYNNADALFRQSITAQVAATRSAQAIAAAREANAQATATMQAVRDQAVWDANSILSSDLGTLDSDVKRLAGNSDFSGVLKAYAIDWAQMQKDYQKEQSDYQQGCGIGGYNAGTVSYDAGTVNYDLGTITYDDGTLTYDQNAMSSSLSTVQGDMKTVQTDWQNLQAAVAADTAGGASARFGTSDVNGALGKAQAQVDVSNAALSDAQKQATQYDNEAKQTNTDAQNLANSMHC